jgi:hypothetical protein
MVLVLAFRMVVDGGLTQQGPARATGKNWVGLPPIPVMDYAVQHPSGNSHISDLCGFANCLACGRFPVSDLVLDRNDMGLCTIGPIIHEVAEDETDK